MKYLQDLYDTYPALNCCADDMMRAHALLCKSVTEGGKILVCGNGGSAADSDHIVGELMKDFLSKRGLGTEETAAMECCLPGEGAAIAGQLQRGIPAISLASNGALMTATLNDMDTYLIFAQQVQSLGRSGDILIAISTSGNSKNVLMAAKVAKAREIKVLVLTGESGGALKDIADVCIRVPANRVDRIQEMHLPVYHALCAQLEWAMFGEGQVPGEAATPESQPQKNVAPRFSPQLIVFDFDGVFTDNKVYTAQDGTEMVMCDRRDGLGIKMLKDNGQDMFILSMEANPVVQARARKLGLEAKGGCRDKAEFLTGYLHEKGIAPENMLYMGNDLNDFEAMKMAGFAVAPADAHPDIKKISNLVLTTNGGQGAVRELCEFILEKKET